LQTLVVTVSLVADSGMEYRPGLSRYQIPTPDHLIVKD